MYIGILSGLKLPNTGFRFNYFMQWALEGLYVDILWVEMRYMTIDTRPKYTNIEWVNKRCTAETLYNEIQGAGYFLTLQRVLVQRREDSYSRTEHIFCILFKWSDQLN